GAHRCGASSAEHNPRPTSPRAPSRANLMVLLILCRCAPRNSARPLLSSAFVLIPIAIASHGALGAPGIPSFAQGAAVRDDGEVPGLPVRGRGPPLQGRPD